MPHFPSEFLAHFPNTPNKRRGDMLKAQWMWEGYWTDEQREKAIKALKIYAVYAMALPVEQRKFEPCPQKWMTALELMDFEPDPAWTFQVEVDWHNESVVMPDGTRQLVRVGTYWRIVNGESVGPFKTRDAALGVS